MPKKIGLNFKKEYKYFLKNNVLKLIGMNNNTIQDAEEADDSFYYVSFDEINSLLYFGIHKYKLFKIECINKVDEDDVKLLINIFEEFKDVCKYKENNSKQNLYVSDLHRDLSYEYALQAGICLWIAGDKTYSNNVEMLMNILDNWSSKTYEGKNVSYGIVFETCEGDNSNTKEEGITDKVFKSNFLKFLDDDFSAVLTDSITSVFVLNEKCELVGYETVLDDDSVDGESFGRNIPGYKLINNLPLRFANIIYKTVFDKRIGIFLLTNGDVILAKKQKIYFVKRNKKWLNFNFNAFNNALYDFAKENVISEKLIKEIYSTVLDVSFSHAGGIIALVIDENIIIDDIEINESSIEVKPVNRCDYISSSDDEDSLKKYLCKKNQLLPSEQRLDPEQLTDEIDKKLLKRKIINQLLSNEFDFKKVNRKLRSELVSLDGACILNKFGHICSFGAIIQNDSGSSGGGRGAAAKKLSSNGIAIKVSTDGYIEVYIKQNKVYVIK